MGTFAEPGVGFHSSTAAVPTSTVELSISCRNVKDADVFSKSDPMCVLFVQEAGQSKWSEIARTEVIMNTLNPDFAKKFILTFYFEEIQRLKFELYDIDSSSPRLSDHDFLGSIETTLAEIVSSASCVKPLLDRGIQYGTIIITAEELSSAKEEISLQFMGKNLPKSRFLFFDSSAPFLTLSKANEDGRYSVLYRTEKVESTDPVWREFTMSVQSLCNGDFDRILKLECHHYKTNGSHKFIGECFLTLNQILSSLNSKIDLQNTQKQKNGQYKSAGSLILIHCQRTPVYSFLDYIRGGTELLCTVAIDFTGSNGDPRSPNSLHYIDPYRPNQYVQALKAVGEIIEDYDSDKLFPVLGFGARLPPDGKISHNFFVTMDPSSPYCFGVDGIINAYSLCLGQIQLFGPTNFSPIINHVASIARGHSDGSKYHILLLITDGIITDMEQTKEAIVMASSLPLSIIIVGVGSASFDAMEVLDGDVVRLSYRGRYAERDIVQFVPFRDFQSGLTGTNFAVTQAKLAKAVLAEVPTQFISFMKKNGIKPAPPKQNLQLPPDPELR